MTAVTAITDAKKAQLAKRMAALGLHEADLEEQFIRGSGKGGQKINKTASCVQLQHKPSGLIVKCQRERSQALNRFFARRELCEKTEEARGLRESEKQQHNEKIRRQKRRRSRRQRAIMLEDKLHHGRKKAARRMDVGKELDM